MEKSFLEISKISKRFRGVQALKDIDLKVEKGEVHSVIGENGAGKSTLIKIISGVVQADSGKIILQGNDITGMTSQRLFDAGISASYQENSLFDNLTIAQNLFIGSFYNYNGFNFRWRDIIKEAKSIFDYFGLQELDPMTILSELPPETRQIIEILKSINRKSKLLCLDEPTASLTESGAELLYKTIDDLKDRGITILYISHNLDEVIQVSDRITVLRDGKKVETVDKKHADKGKLHQLMIGRSLVQKQRIKELHTDQKPILRVEGAGDGGMLENIGFEVYPGEVLGLAGLVGSGRTELAWMIFGLSRMQKGEIHYLGEELKVINPAASIKRGIMYLPEDRKLMGLFLNQNLTINTTASKIDKVKRSVLIDSRKENELTYKMMEDLDVKYASLNQLALKLSGGNQQKVLFGKCLFTDPKLLILDEPTKGIDVGSKEEIYELIEDLVKQGLTIILISSEVEEVCRLSDRVLVMVKGKIKDVYKGDKINEKEVTSCYLQTEKG